MGVADPASYPQNVIVFEALSFLLKVSKSPWIPGIQCGNKQKTRFEHFQEAIESPVNFFFDVIDDHSFAVAPFANINTLLALPEDVFGTPMDWTPFNGMNCFACSESSGVDVDCISFDDFISDDEDVDGDPNVVIPEIGHVPSLRNYYKDIDRRQEKLKQFIDDLVDGSPLGDGWFSVDVSHSEKHGIPSRHIPKARASLAKLTKEARTIAVDGQCREFDKPLSHVKILVRLLRENQLLNGFKLLVLYEKHFTSWRNLWGKAPLTVNGYGGIPQGDAWNPVTWTLYQEIRRAAVALLALPQYAYLSSLFSDRKIRCTHGSTTLSHQTKPLI